MNTNITARNRILSLALALCLALGMTLYLPGPVEVSANVGMQEGIGTVDIGTASQQSPTVVGFGGKEWYVIGYNGAGVQSAPKTVTLLAKNDDFGTTPFDNDTNRTPSSNVYEGSLLHKKMQDIYKGENGMVFFSNGEKELINPVTLDDVNTEPNGYIIDSLSGQRVWPLSSSEANQSAQPITVSTNTWWLRSPDLSGLVWVGSPSGIHKGFFDPVSAVLAVRPAFQLNLASVLFTSDASGKPAPTASLLAAKPPTGAIKFTMEDESQTLNVTATTQQENQTGAELEFGYQGATTGARQWVSCFLENDSASGKDYYGKLVDASNGSAENGDLSIPLSGVDDGDYILYIFSEQENGGNHTDFASKPVTMSVRVSTGNGTVSNFDGDVLSDDADLLKVAGKTITTIEGNGDIGTPYTAAITLGHSWSSITDGDLDAAPGATAALFDSTYSARQSPVNLAVGDNSLYVKVTAEDRIEEQYYHITATRDSEPKEPYVASNTLALAEGETIALTISLGSGDSAAHSATITSEDDGVSTVNPTRLEQSGDVSVTGVAAGKTTLTIGYSGGSRHGDFDTVQVTVTAPDDGGNGNGDGDGNGNGDGNGDGNGGGSNSSGSRSSSRSSGSSTPDSRVAKTQLPAAAFSWDGDRTLTIDHDRVTPLGLQSVRWDDVTLTRGTDFGVYSGSVIIRFGEDFIAEQSPGEHTVKVEFMNHTGEATVTVGQAEPTASGAGDDNNHNPDTGGYPDGSDPGATDNPNTGDRRNIWAALLLGSLGGIALVVRRLKPVA